MRPTKKTKPTKKTGTKIDLRLFQKMVSVSNNSRLTKEAYEILLQKLEDIDLNTIKEWFKLIKKWIQRK